uniref:Uncharacterized protein n=1 Tax=Glossina palpalis gambiensis TaxID=67801 RepID=A0A1B0C757_9MUSC
MDLREDGKVDIPNSAVRYSATELHDAKNRYHNVGFYTLLGNSNHIHILHLSLVFSNSTDSGRVERKNFLEIGQNAMLLKRDSTRQEDLRSKHQESQSNKGHLTCTSIMNHSSMKINLTLLYLPQSSYEVNQKCLSVDHVGVRAIFVL